MLLGLFSCLLPASLQAQVASGQGEIIRRADVIDIAVESTTNELARPARIAFKNYHGVFNLVDSANASVVLELIPAGGTRVTAVLEQNGNEIGRRTFAGDSALNAVLRAVDFSVEQTLGAPGWLAGKLAFVWDRTGKREIYTADMLLRRPRQLTQDNSIALSPHWSPDGNVIVYTGYHVSGFPDLLSLNTRTNRRNTLASYRGLNTGGAISEDGRKVAMILSSPGNPELYVANLDGSRPTRLTRTNQSVEADPTWLPDGRILFVSDYEGSPQLYTISSRGGSPERIRGIGEAYVSEPSVNPLDSRIIAFTTSRGGNLDIAMFNTATGERRDIAGGPHDQSEPVWLRDGRHMVYTQSTPAGKSLMLIDTVSGKSLQLTNASAGNFFSPDFVYP